MTTTHDHAWSFDLKRAAAERESLIDFALWWTVPDNLDQLELPATVASSVLRHSCPIAGSTTSSPDPSVLRAGMRAADLGLIVAVHAESEEITQQRCENESPPGRQLCPIISHRGPFARTGDNSRD
jgi:dihydroorotase-like cyclic amidohydrolase